MPFLRIKLQTDAMFVKTTDRREGEHKNKLPTQQEALRGWSHPTTIDAGKGS